ncbi:hypothetical protein ACHQM5_012032 [Ranunculus cassubicifolius]
MMKGFGYLGQGGPFSNLSPLAPPFNVVDSTTFTIPNQIPENFHEQTYFGEESQSHYAYPARPNPPPHDNWLNLNTPGYGPNTETDTSRSSGYGQFLTNSYSNQSVSRPYHTQYPPVSVQGGGNVGLDVNERGSMLPTSGFTPTVSVGGYWDSKNGGEQWKGKGKDVNIGGPSSYARFSNQGISADGISARDEAPRVWVGKSTESSPGDFFAGAEGIFLPPGKLSSASNENSRNTRFDMSKTPVLNPPSLQEKPYLGPSPDFVMESWSQPYPSSASYGKYFTGGGDSYRTDPLGFYPKSSKSSVDPIYESPSINGRSSTFLTKTVPTNLSPIERPRDVFDRKADSIMRSPSSKGCDAVNTENSDFNKGTSSMINGVEANLLPCVDHSASLQLNLLPCADPFVHVFKAKKKVQVTDSSNLHSTMLAAATGAGDSVECSSEVLEQFNPGVDSPCWKGASGSRYSLFGVAEVGTSDMPAKISVGCNNSSLQGPHVPSNSDNGVAFPTKESEKCFKEDGPSSLLEHPLPVASLQSECSPSSHTEWLSGFAKPNLRPINTFSGDQLPRVDVVINAMQNLSEILLSYSSKDKNALKGQDLVGIGQVIINLEDCLSRDNTMEPSPKVHYLQSDGPNCSEKQANVHEVTIPVEDAQRSSEVKNNSNMSSIKGDNSTMPAFPSGDSELEYDHMTKGIKKILEDNFHDEVEPDIQSLLYKNLWLEAEAALCAVKYKERFARMKTEMAKSRQHPERDLMDMEKLQTSKDTIEVNGESDKSEESEVSNISEKNTNSGPSTGNHEADVDASVLARLHILQSRTGQESEVSNPNLETNPKENEEELNIASTGNHTGHVDASVLARFQILQARINRTVAPKPTGIEEDIVMKPQKPNFLKPAFTATKNPLQIIGESSEGNTYVPDPENYSGKYQWPFIREHYNVEHRKEHDQVEFGDMQSATFVDPFSSGESDSPSPPSDWEHVLKDATWPV